MRIIAGEFKSRKFPVKIPGGVRPTSDIVKESIFNILENQIDLEDLKVLDICAGAGTFGFECLSRGAVECTFVDKSRDSLNYISEFSKQLDILESITLVQSDALKFLKKIENQKFDVIFTDPPYALSIINDMLKLIIEKSLLNENGIMIIEHSKKNSPIIPNQFNIETERIFGEACFKFLSLSSV